MWELTNMDLLFHCGLTLNVAQYITRLGLSYRYFWNNPGMHLTYGSLVPPKSIVPNSTSISSSIFVWLTVLPTHTRLTALFPGLPGWAGTRKAKPNWILLKQETVSGSGISWAMCKSAPRSRQITTPAPHHSSFLQAGCLSCCPTNTVKALKAILRTPSCSKRLHLALLLLWCAKQNKN